MKRILWGFVIVSFLITPLAWGGKRDAAAQKKDLNMLTDKSVVIAKKLVKERSTLARKYMRPGVKVTEDVLRKTCIALADRAKRYEEEDGYIIRFFSSNYRNPVNAPNEDEEYMIDRIDRRGVDKGVWHGTSVDDKAYYIYAHPILAEKSCIGCHGEKKKVPPIITKMYPEDKSVGFVEGDLMGAVAVYTWKGF